MNELEIAWLAGLLEGEGYFALCRNIVKGKVYLYPRITLNMTDKDVVEKAAHLMQINTIQTLQPRRNSKRIAYRITIGGQRAIQIMNLIRPYMGTRRQSKIDELLEYNKTRPNSNDLRRVASQKLAEKRLRNSKGQLV